MSLDLGTVSVKVGADLNDLKRGLGEARGQFANLGAAAKAANLGAPLEHAAEAAKEVSDELAKKPTGLWDQVKGISKELKSVGDEAHHTGRFMRRAFAANIVVEETKRIAEAAKDLKGGWASTASSIVGGAGQMAQAFAHGGPVGLAVASLSTVWEYYITVQKEAQEATIHAAERMREALADVSAEAGRMGAALQGAIVASNNVKLARQGGISVEEQTLRSRQASVGTSLDDARAALPGESGEAAEKTKIKIAALNAEFESLGIQIEDLADKAKDARKLTEFSRSLQRIGEAAYGPVDSLERLAAKQRELDAEYKAGDPTVQGLRDSMADLRHSLALARDAANFAGEAIFNKAQKEYALAEIARDEAEDRAKYTVADRKADVEDRRQGVYFNNSMDSRRRVGQSADVDDAEQATRGKAFDSAKAANDAQMELERQAKAAAESFGGRMQSAAMSLGDGIVAGLGAFGGVIREAQKAFSAAGNEEQKFAALQAGLVGAVTSLLERSQQFKAVQGAMNAVLDTVANALGQLLAPLVPLLHVIGMLAKVFNPIIRIIADVLDPVFHMVYTKLRLLTLGVDYIIYGIELAWNSIVNTLAGWVAHFSSSLAKDIKGAATDTSSIQAEIAKLKVDDYDATVKATNALGGLGDTARSVSSQLSNVPQGFKLALAAAQAAGQGSYSGDANAAYNMGAGATQNSNGSWSIPAHASGGIVTRPHVGMVGEAGPEAIIPLSSPSARKMLGGGGGGTTVNVTIVSSDADVIWKKLKVLMARDARAMGGSDVTGAPPGSLGYAYGAGNY